MLRLQARRLSQPPLISASLFFPCSADSRSVALGEWPARSPRPVKAPHESTGASSCVLQQTERWRQTRQLPSISGQCKDAGRGSKGAAGMRHRHLGGKDLGALAILAMQSSTAHTHTHKPTISLHRHASPPHLSLYLPTLFLSASTVHLPDAQMRYTHTATHRVPFRHHGCSDLGFIALLMRSRVNIDKSSSRRLHFRVNAAPVDSPCTHTAPGQKSEQEDRLPALASVSG